MRTSSKRLGLMGIVVAGLLLLGTACGGSPSKSSGSSDTVASADSGSNASSADNSNSSGSSGVSGDLGSCMNSALAWATLVLEPLGVMTGSSQADLAKMQADAASLRAQIPASIKDDFDTYVKAIQAFSDSLRGVDMSNILDPAVQAKLQKASDAMDTPAVKKASDNVEAYFTKNCS